MDNQNKIFSFKIKRQTKNVFPRDVERTVTQRAHGVYTTSPQRRCIDVEATLFKRHVPAGKTVVPGV